MRYLISALLSLGVLALDQWVKQYVSVHIPLNGSQPFLPGFLELSRVHNYGAAWSTFWGKRWILVVITSFVVLILLYLVIRRVVRHPIGVLACCLIAAGGLGNILDRVRLGYVVDMFRFEFISFPVFNVADVCINVGCALGVIYYLWLYEKYDKRENLHGNSDISSGS